MARYKAPGIAVYQTIQRNAGVGLPDQNVSLVGPSASLRLYNTTAAERERSRAGEYVAGERSVFLWPREIGDDFVDFDYTKVYLRNALLKYGTATATILEKQYNQITVADSATNFQGSRGYRVGDVISIEVGGRTIVSAIHGIESVATLTPIVDADAVPADGNRASGAGYTAPEIVINGTYTGTRDTTYILEVRKGGVAADSPIVRVRTASGDDTVQEYPVVSGNTYDLGTRGLTFTIDFTELIQGEAFSYRTTAVSDSGVKRLILQQNLFNRPADLLNAPQTVTGVEFFILRSLQVGASYYTQDDEQLIIESTIRATDREFGTAILDVVRADVYIEHRIWHFSNNIAGTYGVVNNLAELERALPGALHPDNPLKYGIYKALQNSGETPVIYAAVKEPNRLESWQDAFNRLSKNRNAYQIVPLTDDEAVKRACANFVLAESTDEINRRKTCWIYQPIDLIVPVITYDDHNPVLARVEDNPNAEGIRYDYVLSEDSKFVEAGVRAGDEFRIMYYTDLEGEVHYESRLIQRIINDTVLVLDRPFSNSIDIPQRFEVWRPTTHANFSENIGRLNTWNNRRIIAVHPFEMSADGYIIPGYYGAVVAAAVTASLPPNLASTLRPVFGVDTITGEENFSEANLNDLATSGITMLAKDENGTVYIRHTLTTGDFETIHEREEMTTRNFDNISNFYTANLMQVRGRVTATVEGLTAVFDILQKASEALLRRYMDSGVSGQVVNYTIVSIALDPVFHDVINANIDLELPHMANRIELYLQVVAENSAVGTVLSAAPTSLYSAVSA